MITFVTQIKHAKIAIIRVMRDRIKQVMNCEGMTQSQFADFIEVNRPTLSHILAGRNNPSLEVVMKIHQKFPRINISWLLYGIGSYESDVVPNCSDASSANNQVPEIGIDNSNLKSASSSGSSSTVLDEQPKSRFFQGELFAENAVFTAENTGTSKNRKEMPLQATSKAPYLSDSQIEYAKKSLQRKIVEIKIFYDDGTYETFKQ